VTCGEPRPVTDPEDAWNDVHDATPTGWYVGRPSYRDDTPSVQVSQVPFSKPPGR
jgi:hypothetical protein